MEQLLKQIDLAAPSADTFDTLAEKIARSLSEARGDTNKPTQLRRFYDEIVMWEQKVKQSPEQYPQMLPMIRMLNAKAAYAEGRRLVDRNFGQFMRNNLRDLDEEKPQTFYNFKLLFEAVLGFLKLYNESNKRGGAT
jgi:CRISPR-associated protein Csm2